MSYPKKRCEKCNREFSVTMLNRHRRSCTGYIPQVREEWRQENGKYRCPRCPAEFSKSGIVSHIWSRHTEEGRQFRKANSGLRKFNEELRSGLRVIWSKGLTKETSESVAQIGKTIQEGYQSGRISRIGHRQTKEARRKLSKIARDRILNGWSPGHDIRSYSSYVICQGKRLFLRSSFEFIFAVWLFHRKAPLNYEDVRIRSGIMQDGSTQISDFRVDRKIYEVKGSVDVAALAVKIETFERAKYQVRVVYERQIATLAEYLRRRKYPIDEWVKKLKEGNESRKYFELNFDTLLAQLDEQQTSDL